MTNRTEFERQWEPYIWRRTYLYTAPTGETYRIRDTRFELEPEIGPWEDMADWEV